MRIALVAEGTRGDVAPLCGLASRLVERGHAVRLVTRPDFATLSPPGVEFQPVGPPIQDFTSRWAGAFRGMGPAFLRASAHYREEVFRVQFAELPDALAGCELALGAGMVLGAPSVAEALAIPYRVVLYCPALLPGAENAPAFFPCAGTPPWLNRALWALILGPFDRWLLRALNRGRRQLDLPPLPRAMPHLLSERPLLCADAALAPMPEPWPDRADRIPYLMPAHREAALPEKLEAFLVSGPPPVFFGFGSMPDADPAQTTRWLCAVTETLGCRALVSEGWAALGEAALPPQVERVGDVPHALLFPRVAAVVHHGGAGTTTAAARAGVPQLALPHVLDQFYWGQRMYELGVAPKPLRRDRLRVDRLAERLGALLEAEMLADNAARLGRALERERVALERDPEAWIGRIPQLRRE